MLNAKLLIVEDDEDDYVLTRDLLDEFMDKSYELEWVKTVRDARAALKRDEHDLCLMDYQLGSEDGIQLLKEATKNTFSGPIIMLTGLKDKALDAMAMKAGAVDYLVKANLTRDHLERAIRYALARKETERERVERLRAESASRAKSEFLAHLSHELRTPLTAILGYSDMLYGKVSDLEDKSYLQIIHQNGKHLLGLLNDVLDLSKIEAGKLEIDRSEVALEPFFTDIYLLMNVKAEDKDLQLNISFHGEVYPTIFIDPTRFRQIVINLIGNAIKFTQDGKVDVDVYLEKCKLGEAVEEGECLTVKVSDTGIGIDKKKLESIFQPFTQVSDTTEYKEQGTGLGLTISRELVHRLNGYLSVESELGEGSTFYCRFCLKDQPVKEKRKLLLNQTWTDLRPTLDAAYQGTVLVVDDLLDIRRLIGHIIGKTGVEVIYAENGEEAVDMVSTAKERNKTIDVILMDIQMPRLDGRAAATEMRHMGYDGPIIALTASSMKGDREKCLEAGFTDFLGKPIESHQLYSILDRFLSAVDIEKPALASRTVSISRAHQRSRAAVAEAQKQALVIEDNVDACNITAMLIEQIGWQAQTAYSAKEALEKIGQFPFDVVFFDMNLPDMHGYALVEKLQQQSAASVRFVALSGEEGDASKERDLGVEHHLMKPVNSEMIQQVLK